MELAGVWSHEAGGLELAVLSLHRVVTEQVQTELGPKGASPWDERGQSTQDLDSPARAGDAHGTGGEWRGSHMGRPGVRRDL